MDRRDGIGYKADFNCILHSFCNDVSVMTFLLMEFHIQEGVLKTKGNHVDKAKISISKMLCAHVKVFLIGFIPIIHLGMFWVGLFHHAQVQENAIEKVIGE